MRLLPTALFISVMENQGETVNASLYSEDMVTIKGIYHVLFTHFRFWLLSYKRGECNLVQLHAVNQAPSPRALSRALQGHKLWI